MTKHFFLFVYNNLPNLQKYIDNISIRYYK